MINNEFISKLNLKMILFVLIYSINIELNIKTI